MSGAKWRVGRLSVGDRPRAEKPEEEDWAKLYGQPKDPRSIESIEQEWSHWRIKENERIEMLAKQRQEQAEIESESSREATSDKENECVATDDVRMKLRRRRKSKSRSPSKTTRSTSSERNVVTESQKRRSQPPLSDDCMATRQRVLLLIIFIAILVFLAYTGASRYDADRSYIAKVNRPNLMPIFDRKLADLKAQFPTQPSHNWGVIRSAFAEVLNNSHYEYGPAVLIILASKKDQHVASCFAEKLATSLAKTFNPTERPIQLNGAKLSRSHNSVAAKHTIDEAVRERDNFVMQFDSLEQIDSYTASIFHSLCDYYNSPFRERAVFIFTVHTSEEVEGRHRREYDEMADSVLNEVWDELDVNKRAALIARLTGSTILLRKESRRVC
ncbi:uncharacterized protein LOC111258874 [Varroa jacobsoni]|uniref:uncharacterized protein LOC111258874 n=1 Tax=Varroa jacobsoni TaxID=62625 RepID=UPI000BF3C7E4|nr:uncharacterized protein LOC111258874 [Varroa jacobsoni]